LIGVFLYAGINIGGINMKNENTNTLLFVKMLDNDRKEELRKIEEEQDYSMRKAYLKAKRRQRLREERQRKVRMIVKNVVYGGFGLLFTSVMLIAGIIFTLCI
jgi:hypothetical protein